MHHIAFPSNCACGLRLGDYRQAQRSRVQVAGRYFISFIYNALPDYVYADELGRRALRRTAMDAYCDEHRRCGDVSCARLGLAEGL